MTHKPIYHKPPIILVTVERLLKRFTDINGQIESGNIDVNYFPPADALNFFQKTMDPNDFNSLMASEIGQGYLLGVLAQFVISSIKQFEQDELNWDG